MENPLMIALKITVFSTVFYTALNIGLAYLVRIFPKRLYNPDLSFYTEHSFEKQLYKKLRVAKWKDKFPERGRMVGFSKKSLKSPHDPAYIDQFIMETCIGEFVHYLWGIFGFLSLPLTFLVDGTAKHIHVFIIIATLNLLVQLFFSIIQRYNRPRLIRIRNKLSAKKHRLSSTEKGQAQLDYN